MILYPLGFRIEGATSNQRRLVNARAALAGYASCDDRARVDLEGYLSHFTFGDEFRDHLAEYGTTAGYSGVCHAELLFFDIDREDDIDQALSDARRLATTLAQRYRLDEEDLWPFFSGSKGFHIGLPTSLWLPAPSKAFASVSRAFCERLAESIGIATDSAVYDRVRAFRAPNSRHPKTGLHKRPLTFDELLHLKLEAMVDLAREPLPVDVPTTSTTSQKAAEDWFDAEQAVEQRAKATAERKASGDAKLNRVTLEFIRHGADTGDRHRILFSAAANLAEFGCPSDLAHALLTESALDCGLTPNDVHRQIECGLQGGNR